MNNPWKAKILAFNKKRREEGEKAHDLMTLLNSLPPGQVKNLLKDDICGPILRKYGMGTEVSE